MRWQRLARRTVKLDLAPGTNLLAAAQREHVVWRALDHQQTRIAPVYQHRNAPTLEVERNLIDLAPQAHVHILARQDGTVQRASQAGLEDTVEVGQR